MSNETETVEEKCKVLYSKLAKKYANHHGVSCTVSFNVSNDNFFIVSGIYNGKWFWYKAYIKDHPDADLIQRYGVYTSVTESPDRKEC
jgi:hypothetical protein